MNNMNHRNRYVQACANNNTFNLSLKNALDSTLTLVKVRAALANLKCTSVGSLLLQVNCCNKKVMQKKIHIHTLLLILC